ncbi:MAG: SOS response-associated peptidase [Anaerolineales bacterium]|nr:MAG: SOS response-associated peptidase [Anaerolineales bacterium]
MCGRFSLWLELTDLIKAFPDFVFPESVAPRYNIAPTQSVAVVTNNPDKNVEFFRWGLVPSWAKDPAIGSRMINARSETVTEKPSFRAAFRRRRCLILADGFYEWQKDAESRSKTPMYIRLATGKPFAFAGLWEFWQPDTTPLLTCTILTTVPNSLMAPIHDRMPVILPEEKYDFWLTADEEEKRALKDCLQPFSAKDMIAYPVSTYVNNPRNDSPECIIAEV